MPVEPSEADSWPAPVGTTKAPLAGVADVGAKRTVSVQFAPWASELSHEVATML